MVPCLMEPIGICLTLLAHHQFCCPGHEQKNIPKRDAYTDPTGYHSPAQCRTINAYSLNMVNELVVKLPYLMPFKLHLIFCQRDCVISCESNIGR